jgi:hypothetical protein
MPASEDSAKTGLPRSHGRYRHRPHPHRQGCADRVCLRAPRLHGRGFADGQPALISRPSRNSPAESATRSCVNKGRIRALASRSDKAHSSSTVSTEVPLIAPSNSQPRRSAQLQTCNCNARSSQQSESGWGSPPGIRDGQARQHAPPALHRAAQPWFAKGLQVVERR